MIDQVTRGNRDAAMQDILNTLDGGDTKGMNVITLFTTNHIELIEPTFLRGKRIGSIISLGYLDAETAMNFLETMFKDGYVLDGDFESICKLIADSNIAPAFMAEIVESVQSHMVFMDTNTVRPEYVEASVKSYIRQMQLAKTKDMSITPEQALVTSLKESIGVNKLMEVLNEVKEQVEEMNE